MQTVGKGSVSFGLLNVPVKMSVATARENIQKRYCPNCDQEMAYQDTVRGYEYQMGKFVVIKNEDLENNPIKSKKTIDMVNFIKLAEGDPIYYDKTYCQGRQKVCLFFFIPGKILKKINRVGANPAVTSSQAKEVLTVILGEGLRLSGAGIVLALAFWAAS